MNGASGAGMVTRQYVVADALNNTKALVSQGTEGDGHGARFAGAFLLGLAARFPQASPFQLLREGRPGDMRMGVF